jgi:hypothetical protein
VSTGALAPDVDEALQELEKTLEKAVEFEADGVGGAYVTVEDVRLGERWNTPAAPLTFHLPYNYPSAAPYPYYLPGEVAPMGPWPAALQKIEWRGRQVVQVSLRHNQWDPQRDRVAGCVLQVAERLRQL